MLSSQEEQAERRRVFAQDQSLRSGTFHQHALAEAQTPQGRFSAHAAATVIGSKSGIASAYPAASAAHQTELPPEPALGYEIDRPDAFDPGPDVSPAQGLGDPASDVPSSGIALSLGSMSERAAGSPPSSSTRHRPS